jgi:hypothetical protein
MQNTITQYTSDEEQNELTSEINRMLEIRTHSDNQEVINTVLSEIERTDAVDKVLHTVNFEQVVQDMSAHGNRLRKTKPENADGLTQYVWRYAKFNSSVNDNIPVTANWWLKEYIENKTEVELGDGGLRSDKGKEIKNALELIEIAACIRLGTDPTRMSRKHKDMF